MYLAQPSTPPTRATLAATPTSCTVGVESAAIAVTLDAAPAVGVVVSLKSSVAGDVFHATIGGGPVTSIPIAAGSTTGRFYLVAGTAGARTISIASAGLATVGSPLTITATAPAPTRATLAATPTSCTVGVESAAIAVTLDAAPAVGVVVSLKSSVAGDVFHATIGGGPVTSIPIAAGSTTGRFLPRGRHGRRARHLDRLGRPGDRRLAADDHREEEEAAARSEEDVIHLPRNHEPVGGATGEGLWPLVGRRIVSRVAGRGAAGPPQLLIFFLRPLKASWSRRLAFSSGIMTFPLRTSSGRALKIVEWASPVQWAGASLV